MTQVTSEPSPTADPRHSFAPSRQRAKLLDDWMHDALGSSFDHIRERCATSVPKVATCLESTLEHLSKGGRLRPEAFGAYYELVEAVSSGRIEMAIERAEDIACAAFDAQATEWEVMASGSGAATGLETAFKRRMKPHERDVFGPVDEATRASFAERLKDGLSLLERGMPDIHAEITTIIRTVLLAQAPEGSEIEFDGASHYELWGLVLLNPRFHETRLQVAEVLAHECGHSLLFGMMGKELLVRNPYEDRFPSPLRPDPRPMDGIYHATFVSARMALTMEGLAASGLLSAAERSDALEAAERDRANFASGDSVIQESGDLTETGAAIIANTRDWIARPAKTAA